MQEFQTSQSQSHQSALKAVLLFLRSMRFSFLLLFIILAACVAGSIIPQGQTGLNSLTVLENVKLPFLLYGEEAPTERALALLEELGISPLQGAYPNELSGGELRRLSIARALIREPGIILADEPTGDLDDENTKTVLTLLRRASDRGAAVLLVTHEEDALSYADLVYHMNDGVLREERSHGT